MFPRIPDDKTNFTGLWEEYKLLQDKLDKIGAFRFQVKGWLIPLVSAWLAAVYTAKISPWTNLAGVAFTLLFWLLEKNHHEHQQAFIRRIVAIEEVLMKSELAPYFGPSPKVSKEDRHKLLAIPPMSPRKAIELTNRELRKTFTGKLILKAHGIFYSTVTVSIVLVTLIAAKTASIQSANTTPQSQKQDRLACHSQATSNAVKPEPVPIAGSALATPVVTASPPQRPSTVEVVPPASLPTNVPAMPTLKKPPITAAPALNKSQAKQPIAQKKGL